MPQGYIIIQKNSPDTVIVSSENDALALITSLQRMLAIQYLRRFVFEEPVTPTIYKIEDKK